MCSGISYTDEFKQEAVNQVVSHGYSVPESFLSNLKKEKVRRIKYKTRADARQDVFNYIEIFYNPKRRHTSNGL